MTILKKALIYKYTGLYLAKKEEQAYLRSKEGTQRIERILVHSNLDYESAKDLVIGLWQSQYNFARPLSWLRFREPRFLFIPIAWLHVLGMVLYREFRTLIKP